MKKSKNIRNLIVIFGDQLTQNEALFNDFDKSCDLIWMAESASEAEYVPVSKMRIAYFLSAMRHFKATLEQENFPVQYHALDGTSGNHSLMELLRKDLTDLQPDSICAVYPGEWRIKNSLETLSEKSGIPLKLYEDDHFFSTPKQFIDWAEGRNQIRLEYFYRDLRKQHNVLVDSKGKPEGGDWNYDTDNRKSFGKEGPNTLLNPPLRFEPDSITKAVIKLVDERFKDHYGELSQFNWPVTSTDAKAAFEDFLNHRLADFGTHQDAMWTNEPFLNHSLISGSLNIKLLSAKYVVERVEKAYRDGKVPLNSAEGFIRQVLGWREYVRGLYWWKMPEYLELNELGAKEPLPQLYWDANTPLVCLNQSIKQTLTYGYAHHIQRLMVTGLYGLLLGVDPQKVHEWYLSVYIDAIEWVELPNTLGMSQFADGGLMASKPYVASGKYIERMSNYCKTCPKNPAKAVGKDACPFTTLYWDFLIQHRERFDTNLRMKFQLKNLERKTEKEISEIRLQAAEVRKNPSQN